METLLLDHLTREPSLAATCEELRRSLSLPAKRLSELKRCLRRLEGRGEVAAIGSGRYLPTSSPALVAGRIQITRGGRGFLPIEGGRHPEIAIPASATGTALHEDRVLVLLDEVPRKGLRDRLSSALRGGGGPAPGGRVVRILERRRSRFVGTLRISSGRLSVRPDDPRFSREIAVPDRPGSVAAESGAKVVVELAAWDSRHVPPKGRIVEVLGAPHAQGVDMLGVLRHYGLESDFPAEVLREARSFGRRVREKDRAGRRDCREHRVVTIDPDDARDFDDAICLEPAGRKRWRLWVHIADVSHYVRPGSALDREARKRGNSSYLVDRVVPMLPEALSNELCSLKPGVERLSKCAEFLLSHDGKVLSVDFYPAVIRSRRRFTYAEAMATLQREPRDGEEEMLHLAHGLAQRLRRRRFDAGSLDLDFPETKIRLDRAGRISRIDRHENDASHQLVEEFMLLANEAAAARLAKSKRPALYRSHQAPDPKRLASYREEVLSHAVPCGNLLRPGEAMKLLRRLGEHAVGGALKLGFVRSLKRASYTAEPLGHFGLAKRNYTHFTSPIRRYADLLVHRSLFETDGKKGGGCLRETAESLSARERNSADAERDSKELKLHAHLREQIRAGRRQRYSAEIVGINGAGLAVDLADLGMGGMVPYALLHDDRYEPAPGGREALGRSSGRRHRLGDGIEVEIASVDAERRRVDFRPVRPGGAGKKGRAASDRVGGSGKRRRPRRRSARSA